MTQRIPSGTWQKRVGVSAIVFGLVGGLASQLLRVADEDFVPLLTVLAILTLPSLIGGAWLFWRGRKLAARARAERVFGGAGGESRVLYLRPFKTDASTAVQVFSVLSWATVLSRLFTVEEQLSEAMEPIGQLVAVGKPGEALPIPGAARMYTTDNEWQEVVRDQMRTARLVIIRAGKGQNLFWELGEAVKLITPDRLLILCLRIKNKDCRAFCDQASSLLGVSIQAVVPYRRFRGVVGFIGFGPNWEPRFYPMKGPFFRKGGPKALRRLFQFALRPVIEGYGVEWKRPPVSKTTVAAVTIVALPALAIALLLILAWMRGPRLSEEEKDARTLAALAMTGTTSYNGSADRYSITLNNAWSEIERTPDQTFDRGFRYGRYLEVRIWIVVPDGELGEISVKSVETMTTEYMLAHECKDVRLEDSGVKSAPAGQYAWAQSQGWAPFGSSLTERHRVCVFPRSWGDVRVEIWGINPGWRNGGEECANQFIDALILAE